VNEKRDTRVEEFFADSGNYLSADQGVYSEARSTLLRDLLGPCSGLDIADLGCGSGTLSLQFLPAAKSVLLVDRSEEMLDAARRNTDPSFADRVRYVSADLTSFELTEKFDVVLCIGVLAHVPDVERTLDLVVGATKPGGRCAIQLTDQDQRLLHWFHRYGRLRSRFGSSDRRGYTTNQMSVDSIREECERRGLRFEALRRYGLLFPGVERLPNRIGKPLDRAAFQRPSIARHAVEAIMLFSAP
jgi:ubiquinone/menaquinone biosynthesis C-methylase UbiE